MSEVPARPDQAAQLMAEDFSRWVVPLAGVTATSASFYGSLAGRESTKILDTNLHAVIFLVQFCSLHLLFSANTITYISLKKLIWSPKKPTLRIKNRTLKAALGISYKTAINWQQVYFNTLLIALAYD